MKIGILACGRIAGTMAATLCEMDGVTKYAVASRSWDKAAEFAKKFGFEKAYGSYEELVKDPEVQLIYIASPHSHHFEHIKLCLNNGKNVLCEKAFTVNAKQAEEVTALAKEKGLLLAEAMWVRYVPLVKTLKEILDENLIGEITTVTANLHYSIDMKQRIYDPNLAGGALLDVGVYALTFASLILGDDVKEVTAVAENFDTGVDKQSCYILQYGNGQMAICNSGTQAISDRKGIIYGRNGYIIIENINNPESITVYNSEREIIRQIEAPKQISGYEYEVYACMDAIEKGFTECPDCPHEKTIAIMRLMDRIREKLSIKYSFDTNF